MASIDRVEARIKELKMKDKAAIIAGEYVTFKHVKTRKVVVLEVEVPEELFQDVIAKLGMPIGGESKPVAVCLLNCDNKNHNVTEEITPVVKESLTTERSEGEKLRVRAIMLCNDVRFMDYVIERCGYKIYPRDYVCEKCDIKSRSELATNKEAQEDFKKLDAEYKEWLNPLYRRAIPR